MHRLPTIKARGGIRLGQALEYTNIHLQSWLLCLHLGQCRQFMGSTRGGIRLGQALEYTNIHLQSWLLCLHLGQCRQFMGSTSCSKGLSGVCGLRFHNSQLLQLHFPLHLSWSVSWITFVCDLVSFHQLWWALLAFKNLKQEWLLNKGDYPENLPVVFCPNK